MPVIRNRTQQQVPVQAVVELPPNFPGIPPEVLSRFPTAAEWQRRLDEFWERTSQAVQEAQLQLATQINANTIYAADKFRIYGPDGKGAPMFQVDGTGIRLGSVLVVSTDRRTVHIGVGEYANANTPFYVDTEGNFSLGANLAWNFATSTLTITGVVNATSGTIGGFNIGADYIRDSINSMGLASTVTGGDDVRFWAGAAFASRATAPFRVTEAGVLFGTKIYVSNNALGLPTNPASGQYMVHLGNTDGTGPGMLLDGSNGGPIIALRRAAGTLASPSAVLSGTLIGTIGAMGYGATGFIASRTTEINSLASENFTDTVWGSRLEFKVTAVGAGSMTTAARLDSDGFNSTSIGTTTPAPGKFTTLEATGAVKFGTHSALGAETLSGFISITDAGGTARKLAVVS